MQKRKINMGMVGGGPGSFIGIVHYNAAVLDGQIQLVCGAFSSDPGKSRETGEQYYLDPGRAYGSYREMIEKEKELPEGERMDFICIVTPNHLHYEPAWLALNNGFHVVSDKPLTLNSGEARELVRLTGETGLLFAVTHPYIAYPLVQEARKLVKDGVLGKIRKVISEYPQGWLSTPLEKTDHKQAGWRSDPARSGPCGAMADIGTHALIMAEFVTGLKVTELCADLTTFVPGRKLDDDGNILLRFDNGAKGILFATQIAAGEENENNIRVYGEKGGLEWRQHDPNKLYLKMLDEPIRIIRAGHSEYLSEVARHNTRLPFGHPEGLIEAFANIYRNVAASLQYRLDGEQPPPLSDDFPTVHDGLRGMLFQETVLESSAKQQWVKFHE
jgi:predicted dehydrogenase